MTGHVTVMPEGSLRRFGRPGEPNTLWGTVEEQIAEATRVNAEQWSRRGHRLMPLYAMEGDCPHTDPEDDERFDGVDDLVDAWAARLGLGDTPGSRATSGGWALWWKNRARAYAVIPLAAEYELAAIEYSANHNRVCLLEPMGEACSDPDCHDGDEDYGIEPGVCRLPDRARDAWDEFWWAVEAT